MECKAIMKEYQILTDKKLHHYLDVKEDKNKTVIDAMRYSIFAGGKRLRPIVAIATYNLFKDNLEEVLPYACALEMIHTYSLIHDDLPAMDDDNYRRGKLTNHKVYGEGIAILAGDALLNYAFEIMISHARTQSNANVHLQAIEEIAKAAGMNGMIGGQVVDLESENKQVDKNTLNYIHYNKTAALIISAFKVGAIIAEATETDIAHMNSLGKNIGLAFQIQDDILDIIGDEKKLGKDIGSDVENNKSTYPSLYGLQTSIDEVKRLTTNVDKVLNIYGKRSRFLHDLSHYLVNREV
ncbi:Polyprenyl synthetase [Alkaliphilus metalliredigens QYMF]|uniref:Farnesyl diphosphate synthase n=1 Tax=Alkaliphilus metalliredigens (strain QYMF) TaxID=293826 RepID=A6TR40_ALKMQ|nr:farnesyl diphosphate synthase [Alkaliphilus metalliredigens]ABR48658.1 Polyprenyl synthetase [Alkaliphilus metalliredigens QYMF]